MRVAVACDDRTVHALRMNPDLLKKYDLLSSSLKLADETLPTLSFGLSLVRSLVLPHDLLPHNSPTSSPPLPAPPQPSLNLTSPSPLR